MKLKEIREREEEIEKELEALGAMIKETDIVDDVDIDGSMLILRSTHSQLFKGFITVNTSHLPPNMVSATYAAYPILVKLLSELAVAWGMIANQWRSEVATALKVEVTEHICNLLLTILQFWEEVTEEV